MNEVKEFGVSVVKKAISTMFANDFIKWPPDCVGVLFEEKRPKYVPIEEDEHK